MSETPADKRTDYLTARQLADVLQISETTVHRLRRGGKIPAVYVTDRLVRFNLRDVRRALARAQGQNGAEPDAPTTPPVDDKQMGFADVFDRFESAPE